MVIVETVSLHVQVPQNFRVVSPAERLALKAAELGNTAALRQLSERARREGDRARAVRLLEQAGDFGEYWAFWDLSRWAAEADEQQGAEIFARRSAQLGREEPLLRLAAEAAAAGQFRRAQSLSRPWQSRRDAGAPYVIRCEVTREQLMQAAAEWDAEIAPYPER